jgi:hypothetical protein
MARTIVRAIESAGIGRRDIDAVFAFGDGKPRSRRRRGGGAPAGFRKRAAAGRVRARRAGGIRRGRRRVRGGGLLRARGGTPAPRRRDSPIRIPGWASTSRAPPARSRCGAS